MLLGSRVAEMFDSGSDVGKGNLKAGCVQNELTFLWLLAERKK